MRKRGSQHSEERGVNVRKNGGVNIVRKNGGGSQHSEEEGERGSQHSEEREST